MAGAVEPQSRPSLPGGTGGLGHVLGRHAALAIAGPIGLELGLAGLWWCFPQTLLALDTLADALVLDFRSRFTHQRRLAFVLNPSV